MDSGARLPRKLLHLFVHCSFLICKLEIIISASQSCANFTSQYAKQVGTMLSHHHHHLIERNMVSDQNPIITLSLSSEAGQHFSSTHLPVQEDP
jgi:hypothetical protein